MSIGLLPKTLHQYQTHYVDIHYMTKNMWTSDMCFSSHNKTLVFWIGFPLDNTFTVEVLVPISAMIGREVGNTLDRSPVYMRTCVVLTQMVQNAHNYVVLI